MKWTLHRGSLVQVSPALRSCVSLYVSLTLYYLNTVNTVDFDEETLQRDGGGAIAISEVRLLLLRSFDSEKEEATKRDPMQIP